MENTRKWSGLIWLVGLLAVMIIALGVYTLGSADGESDPSLQQYEGILTRLFPKASAWERLPDQQDSPVYRAVMGETTLGYAVWHTAQGYAGPVEVITGVDTAGVITGIHVGGSEFKETEGLGGKARDASFTDQFQGKHLPLKLGEDVDAISGATITSRAVVDAVNQAPARLSGHLAIGPTAAPDVIRAPGRTANASAIGYGGPVLVRLTLDEEGKIAALDVGGARFSETEGVGSRVREEAFTKQFIGLAPPVSLNKDVDAVSGATVSSQAAVDAVNDAAAFLNQKEEPSDAN